MTRIKYKEAAGKIAKRGKPSLDEIPGKKELEKLYVKELKSIREIAEILHCSKDMVYRALKGYGIELRNNVKRSELRKRSQKTIQSLVERKGVRGAARELEIAPSTLSRFLRSLEEK